MQKRLIAVTGSVALDHIMVFAGHFGDHILAGRTHQINVSFQVDTLQQRRGGTAANICYTLALLGERPRLCAAVGGDDFEAYGAALESAGVDTSPALRCAGTPTAAAYITTDLDNNQITAFHAGAMSQATGVDLTSMRDVDVVVVGADDSRAMVMHVEQARSLGARLVFVPAQQIPSMTDEGLRLGVEQSWLLVGNDYEVGMIEERTGMSLEAISRDRTVAVTRGGAGSSIVHPDGRADIPAAQVDAVVDPTGAGDAYVAGLLRGLRVGLSVEQAGRVGAVAAAFAVEALGPQGHAFTAEDFRARHRRSFQDDVAPELFASV